MRGTSLEWVVSAYPQGAGSGSRDAQFDLLSFAYQMSVVCCRGESPGDAVPAGVVFWVRGQECALGGALSDAICTPFPKED